MKPAALLALALLAGCAGSGGQAQDFAGVYRAGFETSAFWPANGDGPYWVEGDKAAMGALDAAVRRANGGSPWGGVGVEVEGVLSKPGKYGHMHAYERELHVKRVKATRPLDEAAGARG